MEKTVHKSNNVNKHNRWGYIFLIPFVVVFVVFQLIPLISTIYNSFFENYKSGLKQIGPNFIGMQNFVTLFKSGDLPLYFKNTMIMWILGFVPQILVSLLLGAWFTDPSLRLKFQRFFKTVIYLPNLIMASAFSMLFFTLFSDSGPVNSILVSIGILARPYSFMSHVWSVRGLVAMMNFLMWFGNTTILLMAGMMGIDQSRGSGRRYGKRYFLQDHTSPSSPDPDLRYDHIPDRRSADVRCTSDPDQWQGRPDENLHDADHVLEQAPVQQELRYGRCAFGYPADHHRYPQHDRVQGLRNQ